MDFCETLGSRTQKNPQSPNGNTEQRPPTDVSPTEPDELWEAGHWDSL
jgi:hypothetical protein